MVARLCGGLSLRVSFLLFSFVSLIAFGSNPWGGEDTPQVSPGNGPVSRGYIVPVVEPAAGGAKLTVYLYHQVADSPVTLTLQAVINDGINQASQIVNIEVLSNSATDGPNNFRGKREFHLDYAKLNEHFRTNAPNAPQLVLGPGTPLFVYAYFNNSGHQWGGPSRSGLFYLPEMLGQTSNQSSQGTVQLSQSR